MSDGHFPATEEILRSAGAALLDMDGTLVLSEGVHRKCWDSFFAYWGLQVDDREYEQVYMGRRASDVMTEVPGPWTGSDTEQISREMSDLALQLADEVEAVPGSAELIGRLTAMNIPLAVVTSAGAGWAERILADRLGVRDMIDVVVSAERVVIGKPSPEGYLLACAELAVQPDRCLAFEDSPSGVRALISAGVRDIVGLTTTSTDIDLIRAGARWTAADLRPATGVAATG